MLCQWTKIGDGRFRCRHCKTVRDKIRARHCTAAAVEAAPGPIRKVVRFCLAIRAWKVAGSPVRIAARVDELLAICLACPEVKDAGTSRQRCGVCGCPVNNIIDKPTKNKIAMASESCPLDPPRWTAEA